MNLVTKFLYILLATLQIQCQAKIVTKQLRKCQKPQTQDGVPNQPADSNFWPGARVPYAIDSSFDSTDRAELDVAISDYHNKTCIRWYPRSSESAYVYFVKDHSVHCRAAESCYTGTKRTTLFGKCNDTRSMIHQMGHNLCFGHEHARNDRDEYLKPSDCNEKKYDHLNGGHLYDYRSIMHYTCEGKCLVPSMVGVDGCQSANRLLSVLDAEKLNDMNKCGGCYSYRFQFVKQILSNSKSNPVVTGREANGDPIYTCRAYYKGDLMVGKGKINSSECFVPYDDTEPKITTKIEFLTNPQNAGLKWVKGGTIPKNAIPGGRFRDGETLYIGRCNIEVYGGTSLIPGKIQVTEPYRMWYTYDGAEGSCTTFEILTCS